MDFRRRTFSLSIYLSIFHTFVVCAVNIFLGMFYTNRLLPPETIDIYILLIWWAIFVSRFSFFFYLSLIIYIHSCVFSSSFFELFRVFAPDWLFSKFTLISFFRCCMRSCLGLVTSWWSESRVSQVVVTASAIEQNYHFRCLTWQVAIERSNVICTYIRISFLFDTHVWLLYQFEITILVSSPGHAYSSNHRHMFHECRN